MLPRKLAFIPFLLIGSILFPKSGDVDLETPFPRITKYALDLILHTNFPHTKFEGKASINFTWPKRDAAPFIALHIKNIDVTTVKLDECSNTAKDLQFQVHNDILFLPKLEELKGKENFIICIEYSGKINTIPDGLYLSSYMENNATVWYFASHLNPKSPDLLFPCSDDPRDKSIVEIKITHPTDYSVISNTSPEKSERNGRTSITRFQATSLPIPAYMVGLVASKFDQYEVKNDLNITHKIWYRSELKNMHQCAENFSGPIMKAYGNILEHVGYLFNNTLIKTLSGLLAKRPLKLDQVAVPYLPNSAVVVQWGLLTYREDALLCDEQQTGEIIKQKIAETIAYSLQRMSTGLLPVGWRDAWIMEAWATVLAYSILDGIENENKWEMNYQFIVKKVQLVMVEDASIFSTPLQWKTLGIPPDANAAKQISELAKVKGAAIIRMIIMIMNVPKIIDVIIRNEIQVFQETLVEIIQLIEEYKETRKSKILPNMRALFSKSFGGVKHVLPKGVNLSMAMENWIRARGFPIVYVVRKDKKVELSANRYVYNRTYHEPLDNIWYIPISYATSKKPDFENTEVKSTSWIVKTNKLTIDEDLSDGSWIVVNLKSSAYIRVLYDKDLWIALEKALKRNHTQIHVLNRAQIVDDVLELARVYELSYTDHAIPILQYLIEETEYHPLYAALRGFNRVLYRIHSSEDKLIFRDFYYKFLIKQWDYAHTIQVDHLTVLTQVSILTFFCQVEDSYCKREHRDAFIGFINKNETLIPDRIPLIYCMGLESKEGKQYWQAMHDKLTKTNAPSETIAIIKGLACVQDVEILKSYLNELLDKDSPISPYIDLVFKSIAEHSAIGTDAALNFLLEHVHDLVKDPRYSNSIPNMLRVLGITLRTQEQLSKLEELKLRDVMVNFTIPLKRAIFDMEENSYWEAHRKPYLLTALGKAVHTKKSAGMMLIINQILLFIFAVIVIGNIS